jgi:hypothetical protein
MGRILGLDGKPYRSAGPEGLPRTHREAPIQIFGRYTTKAEFQSVVQLHDYGYFQYSSWLASQMLTDSRVASAMGTRSDGLIGKKIVWSPGKLNEKGRRAARDIETDWPLIAPPTARAQMHRWGIISGVKPAQRHWFVSASGRAIPANRALLDAVVSVGLVELGVSHLDVGRRYSARSVAVALRPRRVVDSVSPGTRMEPDDPRLWTVYEPFGVHSWRDEQNLLHSLWEPYFGHALANTDMNRVCEKQGRGNMVLDFPRGTDEATRDEYIGKLLDVGAEGIFPIEKGGPAEDLHSRADYDLRPFEWPAGGWEIVKGTKSSNADEIAILILGHATMQQTDGASVGASAKTGNLIRGDIAIGDTLKETSWTYPLLRDWATANYGDPDCAPIPGYVVEEPMANVAAAQTAQFVSVALPVLEHYGVDTVEMQRRFNFPLVDNPPTKPGPPPWITKEAPSPPGVQSSKEHA